MYFAVVKIVFEHEDGQPPIERKEMQAFCEKLRARFRICVLPDSTEVDDGVAAIVYTSIAHSEESLSKQLDGIVTFCEESGMGRVADEKVLMDHVDSFGDVDD
jgi:hypothetical protein